MSAEMMDAGAATGSGRRTTALVVFESMFGNTARAAQAIAEGLTGAGMAVEVVDVASAPTELPADLDLLVVGAPTHAFGLSRPSTRADAVRQGAAPDREAVGVREWLATMRVPAGSRTFVGVFDTHASKVRWLPQAASSSITKAARRRGLRPTGRHLGLVVNDVKGPLADGERERAIEYGRQLALRCRTAGDRS
jgi:hypothetical protein